MSAPHVFGEIAPQTQRPGARRAAACLFLAVTTLTCPAHADPVSSANGGSSTALTGAAEEPAGEEPMPAPAQTGPEPAPPRRYLGKGLSLALVGGVYAAFWLICYEAWWGAAGHPKHDFEWIKDGWFASSTYSGGADKLGHIYATHVLTRATAGLLREGGWNPVLSTVLGVTASTGTYFLFEMRDGYYTGFSKNDMAANLLGAGLGVVMMHVPWLDERFDTRLQYWPSSGYLQDFHREGFNFNEDYTGMTFLLAYHLSTIEPIERLDAPLRFADLVIGFNAENYRPRPTEVDALQRQHIYLGVSINLQRLADELWLGRHPRFGDDAGRTHRFTQFATEFFNLPFTAVPILTLERNHIRWGQVPNTEAQQ